MGFPRIARAASLAILASGCQQLFGLDPPVERSDAAPDANPNAPACAILAPTTDTSVAYDASVRFMATAIDPQDGVLSGTSITWRSTLQLSPLGTGTEIMTLLPVGTNVVSCEATDSTNLNGIAVVTIQSQSPFPRITHPADGDTRPKDQPIPFTGNARDLEDGTLTGPSLVWTSSVDGTLGTGTNVSAPLSASTHEVTLSATDSEGNTFATSITLFVQ